MRGWPFQYQSLTARISLDNRYQSNFRLHRRIIGVYDWWSYGRVLLRFWQMNPRRVGMRFGRPAYFRACLSWLMSFRGRGGAFSPFFNNWVGFKGLRLLFLLQWQLVDTAAMFATTSVLYITMSSARIRCLPEGRVHNLLRDTTQ